MEMKTIKFSNEIKDFFYYGYINGKFMVVNQYRGIRLDLIDRKFYINHKILKDLGELDDLHKMIHHSGSAIYFEREGIAETYQKMIEIHKNYS